MTTQGDNVDRGELSKFEGAAHKWWDLNGEFKPLHDINPLRMRYITERIDLAGKHVLDAGCGGGILAEALARAGATVEGIDMVEKSLQVARLHMYESDLANSIQYHHGTIEAFSTAHAGEFDAITCMELLEHVPEPQSIISACRRLLKPGGHLFLSTINRNPKAYVLAVLGAEYVLGLLPRGTHNYARFIKPAELAAWLREDDFELDDVTGMTYNPLTRTYRLGRDTDVNYLAHAIAQD